MDPTRGADPGEHVPEELENALAAAFRSRDQRSEGLEGRGLDRGREVDRYQVLEEIGRGGVGVVLRSRDRNLHRDVAMKRLHRQHQNQVDILHRFIEEAQIGGQLQHPGIVEVYDLGLQGGEQPYFTMKLIEGQTLASLLRRRRQPEDGQARWLAVFAQLCHALAYAHSRGVVHRDLKPSNIMVGAYGETQVVDWGFAKILAHSSPTTGSSDTGPSPPGLETRRSHGGTQTFIGSVFGTPAYMPPEQALGEIDKINAHSDVFSLGAILTEILTGKPAYVEDERAGEEMISRARDADLEPARRRLNACGGPPDLVALAAHCLAASPTARPADAGVLAQRLAEHLAAAEERTRAAELEATAARAREAAERRVRNRTRALASAALLVTVGGILLFGRFEAIEEAHRSSVERDVQALLQETANAAGRAQNADLVSRVPLWREALGAILRARERMESAGVETQLSPIVEERVLSTQSHLRLAEGELAQRNRERELVRALEEARIPTDENTALPDWVIHYRQRRDAAYARTFAQFEIDPRSLELADAGNVALEIASALDQWAVLRFSIENTASEPLPDEKVWREWLATARRLDEDPFRNRIRDWMLSEQYDLDALEALSREPELLDQPAVTAEFLADALWTPESPESALRVLLQAHDRHPRGFNLAFNLGLYSQVSDVPDQTRANHYFAIARSLRPDWLEAQHRLGDGLHKAGDFGEAIAVFQALIDRDPQNPHWWQDLGKAHKGAGDVELALAAYQHAIELAPRNADSWYLLAMLQLSTGQTDDACASLRRVTSLRQFASDFNNLGAGLLQAERWEEAIEALERALELDDELLPIYNNLGIALGENGDPIGALSEFRYAIDLDPTYYRPYLNLASTHLDLGEPKEAIEVLLDATELRPEDPRGWTLLTEAYLQNGDEELAERARIRGESVRESGDD